MVGVVEATGGMVSSGGGAKTGGAGGEGSNILGECADERTDVKSDRLSSRLQCESNLPTLLALLLLLWLLWCINPNDTSNLSST